MAQTPQRHHWLNTFVGVLDAAFHLTDEEQFAVADIIGKLLRQLSIPDRARPDSLPVPLSQEVHFGLYTLQLESRRRSHLPVDARAVTRQDCVASLEAWREALVDMICVAYPDLAPEERLLLTKVITDLLAAIGVPNRAAAAMPPAVVSAHRSIDTV